MTTSINGDASPSSSKRFVLVASAEWRFSSRMNHRQLEFSSRADITNDLFTVLSTSHSRLCGFLHVCRHDSLFVSRFDGFQRFFEIVLRFFASGSILNIFLHPRCANFQRTFLPISRAFQGNLVTSPKATSSHQNTIKARWRNDTASNIFISLVLQSRREAERKKLYYKALEHSSRSISTAANSGGG